MNERINELAEQANTDLDGAIPIGFAEKFAQLIVELCIEKVRGVLRDENSDLSYTAADQVQRALKELIND